MVYGKRQDAKHVTEADDRTTLLRFSFFTVFHKFKTVNANGLAKLKVLRKFLNKIVCLAL